MPHHTLDTNTATLSKVKRLAGVQLLAAFGGGYMHRSTYRIEKYVKRTCE